MKKKIDILIPTYNRCVYLDKNITLLKSIIESNNLQDDVGIIISNNHSTDGTSDCLDIHKCEYITVFTQSENIGLEKNALSILSQSTSSYVMYLGDDDYLSAEYIIEVLKEIDDTVCKLIIPSFYPIDMEGRRIGTEGRCINMPRKYFGVGNNSAKALAHLAHQLSGVVYFREGLHESYYKHNVNSIYPFIYFACYCAINGSSVLLTEFPVKVTQPPQTKKDWDYGKDGLLEEKFKCYYAIFNSNVTLRSQLEIAQLNRQGPSLLRYFKKGAGAYVGIFWFLLRSKYVTLPTKLYIPLFMVLNPIISIPAIIRKIIKIIKIMKYEKK